MLKIRTAALGAVLVLGMTGIAGAQDQKRQDGADRGMRQRGGQHGQVMKDLNLSDAQKSRFKAIHEKYRPQLKALMEQNRTRLTAVRGARQKGDTSTAARAAFRQQREQFRQRVVALRGQERAEIRAVLTADQRTKWDAQAQTRVEKMEGRRQRSKGRTGQRRGA